MAHKLTNLIVDEGSFVDKGANEEAKLLLFKRDDSDSDDLSKAGRKISGNRMSVLKDVLDQMATAFGKLKSMLGDVETAVSNDTKKGEDMPNTEELVVDVDVDELTKSLDEAKATIEELTAKADKVDELEKRLGETETPKEDDVLKGASDEVRERFEAMEKRLVEADEIAKEEREKRIVKEYQEAAKAYPHIGESDKVAEMLRMAHGVSEDFGKNLEETLAAANGRIDENDMITKELGASVEGESDSDSKLDAMAKAHNADHAGLSIEQSMAAILKTDEGRRIYAERSEI